MANTIKNINGSIAASCYFRSSADPPYRKALLQITEHCNLLCAHCFIPFSNHSYTMPLEIIRDKIIPRLKQCRVNRVTLTGGEPFIHPDIIDIVYHLRKADIGVGICTNATIITIDQIKILSQIGGVHLNVSLDGFRPESHGKFRGDMNSFEKTINAICKLSQYKLLQGILVTPNNLAKIDEYVEICDFASKNGAAYVLLNPLANMGRGVLNRKNLALSNERLQEIKKLTVPFNTLTQLVYIRFPNHQLPLAHCIAGNLIYVFAHGEVTICPYLIFASKTPKSKHKAEEFIVGNAIQDFDLADKLDVFKFHERYHLGNNSICKSCLSAPLCGKGCPAAVIAAGDFIEEIDREICPAVNFQREFRNE